jgi:phosphatidylserine decarboxylase
MMTLTKYGRKEWLGSGVIIAVIILLLFLLLKAGWVGFTVLTVLLVVFWICIAAFFRDPKRVIPLDKDILIAPADGKVKDIRTLENCDYSEVFGNKPVLRVGIFLSVFNVHVNRVPCKFEVTDTEYKEGRFHDARNDMAVEENESNAVLGIGEAGGREFPIVVKQISGAVARKIVCEAKSGSSYKMGEKFGMIKFGSRTEVYLPAEDWIRLKVKVGDKIHAGETIIAGIKQ